MVSGFQYLTSGPFSDLLRGRQSDLDGIESHWLICFIGCGCFCHVSFLPFLLCRLHQSSGFVRNQSKSSSSSSSSSTSTSSSPSNSCLVIAMFAEGFFFSAMSAVSFDYGTKICIAVIYSTRVISTSVLSSLRTLTSSPRD